MRLYLTSKGSNARSWVKILDEKWSLTKTEERKNNLKMVCNIKRLKILNGFTTHKNPIKKGTFMRFHF